MTRRNETNTDILRRIEHTARETNKIVRDLAGRVGLLIEGEMIIMSQLTDALDQAEAAAAANSSADDAAEALLVTIAQMLKDALTAGGDQTAVIARVSAIATGLNSRSAQLGAAVAANTPAAPPAEPPVGGGESTSGIVP